jgi:hypothetical protein
MDAYTLGFIGIWTAIFIALGFVAYLCQKWENYIRDNIINKK